MGIYDRDYIRTKSSGRYMGASRTGVPPMRLWSMTTWLIIINCAVFAIDFFTPIHLVMVDGPRLVQEVQGVSPSELYVERPDGSGVNLRPGMRIVAPVRLGPNGPQVGEVTYLTMNTIERYLYFSTSNAVEFWRFLGFQFLHANFQHLLFNMIGLFFFGPIVESYLGRKRYLAFYLLSGICGALMYLLLNFFGFTTQAILGPTADVPMLLVNDPRTPLVGASAGVFGVLMAGAYLAPNAIVLLFFIIPLRFKWLAYGLVAVSLFTLLTGGPNAGGEAGHLGGAIAGFYFIRNPHHLHGFFDILGYADPTSHHYHEKKVGRDRQKHEFEIDRILQKISDEGMGSLTESERRRLRDASRRDR